MSTQADWKARPAGPEYEATRRAVVEAAEAIVRQLDRIPAWSTDLAAEAKDGPAAVRRMLKQKSAALSNVIAEEQAKSNVQVS